MLVGKPLFPGSSSIDQIEKIFTRIEVGPKSLNAIRRFCSDYAVGVAEKASAARKSSIFEDTLAGCDAVSLIVCFVIFFPLVVSIDNISGRKFTLKQEYDAVCSGR